MPKKKKPATEMTTEEVMKQVFPPRVVAHLKDVAQSADAKKSSRK